VEEEVEVEVEEEAPEYEYLETPQVEEYDEEDEIQFKIWRTLVRPDPKSTLTSSITTFNMKNNLLLASMQDRISRKSRMIIKRRLNFNIQRRASNSDSEAI